jgi:flagellar basal-body rod modification protein FlgD
MSFDLAGISKSSNAAGSAASGTTSTSGTGESSDRFLKLLVAQLKNQDPLNPLDNAQVTSQMAQISTVQGIEKLKGTMGAMLNQIQVMQAGALTGKEVMIDGNSLTVGGDSPARVGFEVPEGVSNVNVEVRNAQGAVVATIPQSNTPGMQTFNWTGATATGTAPPGKYTFTVSATAAGRTGTLNTFTVDRISGVTPNAAGPRLNLAGGSTVTMDAIRTIL